MLKTRTGLPLFITLITLFLLASSNEVKLSYEESEGKELVYRTRNNGIVQIFVEGYSKTSQTNSVSTDTFTYLGEDTLGNKEFLIAFGDVEATKIIDGEISPDEDKLELVGEKLRLKVTPDWKLEQWYGLETLGYDEAGMDRGKLTANTYLAFTLTHLPDKPVTEKSKWEYKFPLELDTERGKMIQNVTKSYEVKKFRERNGHNCVEIEVKVDVAIEGEGETFQEGQNYKYWSKGKGKGKGKILFDYENGYIFEGSTNWLIDFEIVTEAEDGNTEKMMYSQETKQTLELDKK